MENTNVVSNDPVIVNKSVTIFRKEESSAYFKRNAKFMPEGKNKIGSAINSVSRMKSNIEELGVYMPILLGINKQDAKFTELVDSWFNNLSTNVPETGLTLDIGFMYHNENSKNIVEKLETEIYNTFNETKKNTSAARDAAFALRDESVVNLEKSKYRYGRPINIADYLLWRYCLVYSDVANDIALVNKSGGIRFYIYDSVREQYKERIQFEIRNKATKIYVQLLDMPSKVTNMLWVEKGGGVELSKLSASDKLTMLENLSRVSPADFIKLFEDKNLDIKATIERMIHYNILKRLPNTNVIVDENNDLIGNSMDEVIIFFKNTERNKAAITRFNARLANYTNG